MPPTNELIGPPYRLFGVRYPMQNKYDKDHPTYPGFTTDRWYADLCTKSFKWPPNGVHLLPTEDEFYTRKKEVVVEVQDEMRRVPGVFELGELASWWYDPNKNKIDRDREVRNPGSSVQLGLYVAILNTAKERAVVALKDGKGMTAEQAQEHEKELDKILQEDEELKKHKLTTAALAKIIKETKKKPTT